jgi:NHS family xanthosine MFS transporter
MAFDFFNISGSLFVEKTDSKIRSSAQGLFMMMTNGLGILGDSRSVSYFTVNNRVEWPSVFFQTCLVIMIALLF